MTRPLPEREAIGRGPKGGASGVDTPVRVEVEGLLRKDHGLEGLLLGMPPSVSVPKASLPGNWSRQAWTKASGDRAFVLEAKGQQEKQSEGPDCFVDGAKSLGAVRTKEPGAPTKPGTGRRLGLRQKHRRPEPPDDDVGDQARSVSEWEL